MNLLRKLRRQIQNVVDFRAISIAQMLWHIVAFPCCYFRNGKMQFPINITMDLTFRCNLKCEFCFIHFSDLEMLKMETDELKVEEIRKFINSVKRKRPSFFLTGGEVTLRSDLCDIIKMIKKENLFCGIFTNGTHLDREISDCIITNKLDYVMASIDGPRYIHDEMRGRVGSFDRTYANIEYLCKNKKRTKVILNTIILDKNLNYIKEIIKIGRAIGVDVVVYDFLTFLTEEEYLKHKQVYNEKFGEDFVSFVYVKDFYKYLDVSEKIIETKREASEKRMKVIFKPDLNEKQIKGWYSKGFTYFDRCVYPYSVVRISPSGNVYPCAAFFSLKMGNIRESNLESIWNSEKYKYFRRLLKQKGTLPGCNRCVKV